MNQTGGMMDAACPFCLPCAKQTFFDVLMETEHVYAVFDNFPATKGHVLIIPRQHFAHWFATPLLVQQDMVQVLGAMQQYLMDRYAPDGFNIGMNCGHAAGQTVPHTHLHVIPRYLGDVAHPAGGVRNILNATGSSM